MSSTLLTYEQALTAIRAQVAPLGRIRPANLDEALGLAIAETVVASEANPRFDNSAVDGYAVGRASDAVTGSVLNLRGSVAAGELQEVPIASGAAVRILTGAPVPPGTYGIAMQEDILVTGGTLLLNAAIAQGDFIRRMGSDFLAGHELVPVGTRISSGVSGLLAFAGCLRLRVFEPPSVTVVTTGDELVDPGQTPSGSQIRDTNSVMLANQVRQAIGVVPSKIRVADDENRLAEVLKSACAKSDVVLIAGGASVGDRDYVAPAVQKLGSIVFHGVAIRPGKPFLFGRIGECWVFGLPGNPASSFVCFEIFVQEALKILSGNRKPSRQWVKVPTGFRHESYNREDFVRVILKDNQVVPTEEQGSFGLTSIATAEALARFPANEEINVGEECLVTMIGA